MRRVRSNQKHAWSTKGMPQTITPRQLFILLLAGAAQSSFAMNAGEWYAACSESLTLSADQRRNATPEKKVLYRQCKVEAIHAWCGLNLEGDSGGVYSRSSESERDKLHDGATKFCPTAFNTPLGGPYVVAQRQVEKDGGPSTFDRYFPAKGFIQEALTKKYPACQRWRREQHLINNAKTCVDAYHRSLDLFE